MSNGFYHNIYENALLMDRERRKAFFRENDNNPKRLEKVLEIAQIERRKASDPVVEVMVEQLWIALADKYEKLGFTDSYIAAKRQRYLDDFRQNVYVAAGLTAEDIKALEIKEPEPVSR